jgi:hypothetical protein
MEWIEWGMMISEVLTSTTFALVKIATTTAAAMIASAIAITPIVIVCHCSFETMGNG